MTENEEVRCGEVSVSGEDLEEDLGGVGGEGQENLSATAPDKAGGLTAASRLKSNQAERVPRSRVVQYCCEFENLFENGDCEIPATTALTIAQEEHEESRPGDVLASSFCQFHHCTMLYFYKLFTLRD